MLRNGFLRITQDTVLNVFMWSDPTISVICLLLFTLTCLYPVLLFLLPNILLIGIAFVSHPRISGMEPQRTYTIPPKISPQEYKLNMQFIQNFMGTVCQLVDNAIIQYHEHLAWRNEDHTMKIIQLSIASMPIVIIVYLVVPFNLMCLFGGWGAFLINSPIKDHMNEILPILKDIMQPAVKAKQRISELTINSDALPGDSTSSLTLNQHPIMSPTSTANASPDTPSSAPATMSATSKNTAHLTIYENQRKVNAIYVQTSTGNDPPPYSDIQGTIPFPCPKDYKPPPGYTFLNEWHVDSQWAPVDDNGWCLTDDDFKKTNPEVHTTRRRKWARIVVMDDQSDARNSGIKKRTSVSTMPMIMKSQGSLTDPKWNSPPMRSSSLFNMKSHDDKSTDEEIIEEIEDSMITEPTEEHIYEYSYK